MIRVSWVLVAGSAFLLLTTDSPSEKLFAQGFALGVWWSVIIFNVWARMVRNGKG